MIISGLTVHWGALFQPSNSNLPVMYNPPPVPFDCPNCGAKYEVVLVEAPQSPQTDREITCVSCGGPMNGREGKFILKYFLSSVQNGALMQGARLKKISGSRPT